MKYSTKDLQIIVLTHNRADLLDATLLSIRNQTAKGFKVTILDNGSTDNTQKIIEKYKGAGFNSIKNEINIGGVQNFFKAMLIADSEWTMVFHDDDLMHPGYIEAVMRVINMYDDIVLVGCGFEIEQEPKPEWGKNNGKHRRFMNVSRFAQFVYNGFLFHFGSAVYKTEIFKSTVPQFEVYGKIFDRPFLFDVAEHGVTVVFTENYVKYRIHNDQDSVKFCTGPFIDQLIALHKKYHTFLGDNLLTSSGRTFLFKNYIRLRNESSSYKLNMKEYLARSLMEGPTTKYSLFCGKLYFSICRLKNLCSRAKKKVFLLFMETPNTTY